MAKSARARAPGSGSPNLRVTGEDRSATAAIRAPIETPCYQRHAVAVLDTAEQIHETLGQLSDAGIGHSAVSLMAPLGVSGTVCGKRPGDWAELGVRSSSGAGLASCGPLSESLLRLCSIEEAAIDVLLARWLPAVNAGFLAGQLDLGRVLLWVHLLDADDERRACGVLLSNSRHGVQVHDLPARP